MIEGCFHLLVAGDHGEHSGHDDTEPDIGQQVAVGGRRCRYTSDTSAEVTSGRPSSLRLANLRQYEPFWEIT
jgi:hypothetical protein